MLGALTVSVTAGGGRRDARRDGMGLHRALLNSTAA
jgi:hypothetical protein